MLFARKVKLMNKEKKSRTIKVDVLARVEGEGALYVKIKDNQVTDVQLKIFEPPRFFEAFLRGRAFTEVPDITARICGICPIAYMMSACHAMENAIGVKVEGQLRELRRLIYCGEWIESHGLHVFMLHAPDFLGYDDAIQMAKNHQDIVNLGLQLKKVGNEIVSFLGGREIHPINVRVGGFYKVPKKSDFKPLKEKIQWARDASLEALEWLRKLPFPDFEQDYEFVSLRHPEEYPFNEGRLVSNKGLDIAINEYDDHFVEEHVSYTHALHSVIKGRESYFTGPLARYNLNFDRLPAEVQDAARSAGLDATCRNPFKSIIVRTVETLYALTEAIRIIDNYERPDRPAIEAPPCEGVGYGCTEAPRGSLYHHYRIDRKGNVLDADIIPPTSQNQKQIEKDLWEFIPLHMNLTDEELTWQCERAIRNYDPCISCATHFLKLKIERG